MIRRKLSEWYLMLRLVARVFKPKRGIRIKTCGLCKGLYFDTLLQEGDSDYYGIYKCVRCGAIGKTKETWRK